MDLPGGVALLLYSRDIARANCVLQSFDLQHPMRLQALGVFELFVPLLDLRGKLSEHVDPEVPASIC
jgi:hypothetical protein